MNEFTNDHAISHSSKPLLLLDVDGVLNAFPNSWTPGYTRHVIEGYPIHLHDEVAQMVSALDQAFEIVWFTLWNHRAAPGIGPHVGLAEADHLTTSWERGWDVAYAAGRTATRINQMMYAKTPLLPELVGTERQWVWIDDAHGASDHEYLVDAGFDPRRFRLVQTDPEVGLTWSEVNQALEFAQAIADGVEAPVDESVDAPAAGSSIQGPGSAVGRVDAVTTADSEPAPIDRDNVYALFRELMAGLGEDGLQVCTRCVATVGPGSSTMGAQSNSITSNRAAADPTMSWPAWGRSSRGMSARTVPGIPAFVPALATGGVAQQAGGHGALLLAD